MAEGEGSFFSMSDPKEQEGGVEKELKLKKDIHELKMIAQIVGNDFKMDIEVGTPGGGSFFDQKKGSITFDPLHIEKDPDLAKFVAGHEGSHRAVTPSPEKFLLREKVKEDYSQVGFGFLQNSIEDPAVNNWMKRKFPGLGQHMDKTYDKMFEKDNVVLGTPETQAITEQLGFTPKFVQYGSEIIKHWHQKQFSSELDPVVEKALGRTMPDVLKSIATIPEEKRTNERNIISAAKERYHINSDYIWPEYKKLVDMDIHAGEQRQMIEDFKEKEKTKIKKEEEMKKAGEQGDAEKKEKLKKEIEKLEKDLAPFDQLPEEVKKDIQEKTSSEKGKPQQDSDAKDKPDESKNGELGDESSDGKEKGDGSEKGKPQQDSDAKDKPDESKNGELGDESSDGKESINSYASESKEFSEETKNELEKLWKGIGREKQEEFREKTKTKLEDLEDAINKEMEGKLNEDKIESHKDRRELEEREREVERIKEEEKELKELMDKILERKRLESMTPYEKSRAEVLPLIDDLYYRLRQILKPDEYGGEDSGHPSGQILDFSRVMQTEQDKMQKYKLWIKETAPGKKDYRFWHLVDLSQSMEEAGKIQEAFKGFIVAGEAIDRLEDLNSADMTIHQGITGFNDSVFPFKDQSQRYTKDIEDKLSEMPSMVNGGTNTYRGTVAVLENIKENLGETGNFILTFSDGEPNRDIRYRLEELLKNGKEERARLKIKVGLIWLGENDPEELDKLVKTYGYDFGLIMSAEKKDRETGKNFSELLADLLEDIIKEPNKY
ncbi:MAG: hypothetical protein WC319_03250 [Candidatus Paceibacterota bacterium]|jgi:hypothetical protein